MKELNDLENYLEMQFTALSHICESPTPWIFVCLSTFVDFLAQLADLSGTKGKTRFINFVSTWYPKKYKNFKYDNGKKDLPEQVYFILRSGLVHSFSLTPDPDYHKSTGRRRSVRLFHRKDTSLKNITRYPPKAHKAYVPVFIAEDFLDDTRNVAMKIVRKAKRDSVLKQHMIKLLKARPPIAGAEQGYFWLK